MKVNLSAFVTALTVLPQVLPLVDQVVKNVEDELSTLPGSQKLAAAEAKVNTYLTAFEQDVTVVADLKDIVTPLINGAVAAFNAIGIFKHKPGGVAVPNSNQTK